MSEFFIIEHKYRLKKCCLCNHVKICNYGLCYEDMYCNDCCDMLIEKIHFDKAFNKKIFHGACLSCTIQQIEGIEHCKNCLYCNPYSSFRSQIFMIDKDIIKDSIGGLSMPDSKGGELSITENTQPGKLSIQERE